MNITELCFKNRVTSYFIVVLIVLLGIASFNGLGQLEDPDFSVKKAGVLIEYPGASPEEVELEVTDRIEQAIQEMPQLKHVSSTTEAGKASILVDIKQEYWGDELPQVWDELRKKVRDASKQFPPGVKEPKVQDDFNFVYGFLLAITGDGYTYSELEEIAKAIKKEFSLVEGVSRVELWGVQQKVIYIDVAESQLAESGLTPTNFSQTLQRQNMVFPSGSVDLENRRMRISPSGEFTSPEEIGELYLHPFTLPIESPTMPTSQMQRPTTVTGQTPTAELIKVKDIGIVSEGYRDPPAALMRFDGKPAIGISLANVAGGNVVETGRRIEKRLNELRSGLPAGIEVEKIAWQSDLVSKSINDFMVNLAEAVAIVLVVLTIAMGWRMGIIIGTALILTILAVFTLMAFSGIDLHRVSLGALIIALGMMVDNAIVVSDGIVVRMKQGMNRMRAAIQAATSPAIPLLGATVVACMAFYPIWASKSDTGEYAGSLFTVVAFALLLSWILAITITPLQCHDMIPDPDKEEEGKDPYGGIFFVTYRKLLELCIKRRGPFLLLMAALLGISIFYFGDVKRMFFPSSTRPQLMVDFWYPQGARIQDVAEGIKPAEDYLMQDEGVLNISSFIGAGPPRFYLPVDPQSPTQNYAQIIVNTEDFDAVNTLVDNLEPWLREHYSDPLTRVRRYAVGPGNTWKFEWYISGPATADLETLRKLGDMGADILAESPYAHEIKTAMMNKTVKVVPEYNQARGRFAGVQRDDIGTATQRLQDGEQVGLYREKDDLYPILLRNTEEERQNAIDMDTLQIRTAFSTAPIPLAQVTSGVTSEWENPIISRWHRRRANIVQGEPYQTTYPDLKDQVIDAFDKLPLPPFYEIYMKGEDESTRDSNENLRPGMLPAVVVMLTILVMLFNSVRTPLIIILTIPFAIIGITWGLLLYGSPFGFMALLGAMSLSGMMIKNAVVLLDQINLELSQGKEPYEAVVDSSVSRLRPVLLGAITTVLGVYPLITDVFWEAMTVTIMGGLTFGTFLTMLLVPVIYCVLYRVKSS